MAAKASIVVKLFMMERSFPRGLEGPMPPAVPKRFGSKGKGVRLKK
jgi:hypothetical protein